MLTTILLVLFFVLMDAIVFSSPGNGKNIQIYDGRKSLNDGDKDAKTQQSSNEMSDSSRGEIIYFRDSDDEMPDSDEDPDDDLDI